MTGPLDRLDASKYGDPEDELPPHVAPPQDDAGDDRGNEIAAELRREADQLREGLVEIEIGELADPSNRHTNRLIGKIEAYETIADRLDGDGR